MSRMEKFKPEVIQRLFLKQMRNLTKYNTVYYREPFDDDIYSDAGVDQLLENDELNVIEASSMKGYLSS